MINNNDHDRKTERQNDRNTDRQLSLLKATTQVKRKKTCKWKKNILILRQTDKRFIRFIK